MMKKKYFLLLGVLLPAIVFSQNLSVQLNWNDAQVFTNDYGSVKTPSFNEQNFVLAGDGTIKFYKEWNVNQSVDETSVQVINPTFETISESALFDLDRAKIPTNLNPILLNSKSKQSRSVYFEINPILKQGNTFKRIKTFEIVYQVSTDFSQQSLSLPITNSVLSSGEWYRFFVDSSGVHTINKSFLNSLGINTSALDPRTIRVFGTGGKALPLRNSQNLYFDPEELAVQVTGESDGSFDSEDAILFYAEGPNEWNAESDTNLNSFVDKTYYYLNVNAQNGKRITPMVEPVGVVSNTITTFLDFQFHEEDNINIGKIGRRWFGEKFDVENVQTFDFNFPNIDASRQAIIKVNAAAVAESSTSMQVNVGATAIGTLFFSSIGGPIIARGDGVSAPFTPSATMSVVLNYNNNGNPSAEGFLDYISIAAYRQLQADQNQFRFYNPDVLGLSGIGEYVLSNASGISEVWDITDLFNVKNKINDQGASFAVKANMGQEQRFVAIAPNDLIAPKVSGNPRVTNQNIKGTVFQNSQGVFRDVDYLIISPNFLISQANRLADFHRQNGLNVKVVSLADIYKEFSSGNADITAIRNFVRYVYNNASTPEKRIKYLCMFGDSSYDYKDRITGNTNIAPTFHSLESFSLASGFMSDDFYTMMDPNEGTLGSADKMDIAVGRILAETTQRANEMVSKILAYYDEEARGRWRNTLVFVSDDVDQSDQGIQLGLNNLADEIKVEKPFFNITKLHTDSFIQESSAGGDRYPSVNVAIRDAIEVGALVVNYFGHGGEDGLAVERIFEKVDSQEINNICKNNLFVTITCEYTRFDNPERETAGEFNFWNPTGGAVALVTTTRQIFVSVGQTANLTFAEELFAYGSDTYPTIAEALMNTKNNPFVSPSNGKVIFYIGDPAMKLAIPKPAVRLTTINDMPITGPVDTLEALDLVKIGGELVDQSGVVLSNYSGKLSATIYDKVIQRQTLGNDGTTSGGNLILLDYVTLGEILFRGQAQVTDGLFDFEFVVPRDIGIPVGPGRISFYSENDTSLEDQNGYNETILVGGINADAPEDNNPPTIRLYMNDESFISGGFTNEAPYVLAFLGDENGINTASGIGHDIEVILDGDEENPFVLNDYYETELDNYKAGSVKYQLRDLAPGIHTLSMKVWDVYNNSATQEIQFEVFEEGQSLKVENVLNYPNPFVNHTEFWFNHNSSTVLDIMVQVYTVSGKLVRTLRGSANSGSGAKDTSTLSRDVTWDGLDDFGDKIGKGVYVYKLTVRSPVTNKQVSKFEKLVIL
jgi:hypothetical protein